MSILRVTSIRLFIVSFAIFSFQCQKVPEADAIAIVGKNVLHKQQLSQLFSSYTLQPLKSDTIALIKLWIDTELLYQEALRQGLHKSQHHQLKMQQFEKQLLASEIQQHLWGVQDTFSITESMIKNYFHLHRQEFVRDTTAVLIGIFSTSTAKEIWEFRARLHANNFFALSQKHSLDSMRNPADSIYTAVTDLPKAVAEVASSFRTGAVSLPIPEDGKYFLIIVYDRQPSGSRASFAEARNQVIATVQNQIRQKAFGQILSELRMKNNVEVFFEKL